MDNMIYLKELPWVSLGKGLETPPTSADSIMKECGFDWTSSVHKMSAEDIGLIPGWYTVQRDDTKQVLGVISSGYPNLVANVDMFNMVDDLLGDELEFQCAGEIDHSRKVFGAFKFRNKSKILDDDAETYMIIMNDHLKADNKVTVVFTPVRVVCQNMLMHALYKGVYSARVPVTRDVGMNRDLGYKLIENAENTMILTSRKMEKLASYKVSSEKLDKLKDDLFPYQMSQTGDILDTKANDNVTAVRESFNECLVSPNLDNYEGTAFAVYNALTDFEQHWYKSATKAYDLNYRMTHIPTIGTQSEPSITAKFTKNFSKYAEKM